MSPRTEQELLDCIVGLATRMRWAVHHDRPARRAGAKWVTAIAGHAGFPDLVLARGGVVLFRELKGYDRNGRMGRLSSEQRDWGRQLAGLPTRAEILANAPRERVWDPFARRCWPTTTECRIGGCLDHRRVALFDVWTPDDWDTLIMPTLTATPARRTARASPPPAEHLEDE